MTDKLLGHLIKADQYVKSFIYKLSPLYREEFGFGQDVTVPLFTVLHSYSESALILLQNGGVFEADILLRCTMEGTVKYCYLMTGSDEQRRDKYREYKEILPELDKLHDHQKAKDAIETIRQFSNNNLKPFETMIIPDEDVERIKSKYSKRDKNMLKQKWSYHSLLEELAQNGVEYEAQLGSLSTYAITSHYCHLDYTGLQDQKAQIRASAMLDEIFDYAHALRIIANILSFYLFRVLEYMRCNNYFPEEIRSLCVEVAGFERSINDELNEIINSRL